METKGSDHSEAFYSVTTTTAPDMRTALATDFYCDEIQKQSLGAIKTYEFEHLAAQSVRAAEALIAALNEKKGG